ncbi:DUF1573 domain-containing protein [Chondrinema litorale]|uniref:DUF1573 domain-containing protein n=1 Tax=Chondrinema litorale TaxID=2994555 RepID=UPI0025448E69|nr:DUF1573 domain-containing protein [Chondrinema litorale]UZR95132.1 DUF1573 domain-containing protein [Chondrinema litorale]
MLRKIFFLALYLVIHQLTAFAQNGIISFENTRAELGSISEEEFPVKYKFEYIVAGSAPVKISTVDTDCACTVSNFSTEAVEPGSKGYVEVIFSPYKAGPFQKSFTVIAENAVPKKTELVIDGFIEPFSLNTSIDFPYVNKENLRFRNKYVFLGNITNKGIIRRKVEIYNDNDSTYLLADSITGPDYMEIGFSNGFELPSRQPSNISLFYNPELKNDFGEVTDSITLYKIGESEEIVPAFSIVVKASIQQHFSNSFSESELGNFPKLVVSDSIVNLGNISLSENEDKIVEFVISNSGETELEIQKIVTNYGCEIYKIDKRTIEPFDFTNLKVAVKDIGKKGTQDRSVLIYCNDPNNTVKQLTIKLNDRE